MAISQAVAQAILGQRTPDIMGAFEQGQETALKRQERDRQEKIRELSGMALQGDDESMKELTGIAPELSLRMQEAIGAQDDAALARFIKDAKVGESLLIDGNVQGFLSFADQRIKAIKRMGGDTAQTERIAALVRAGDTDTAIQELTAFSSAIDQAKQITDTPRQREFAQFAAMPEGTEAERTEKRQFGQAIGAIAKREGVKEAGEKAIARAEAGKVTQSINKAGESFEKLKSVNRAISNIDAAIQAIDDGAETGVIQSKLPSIKAASVRLDQIRNDMGLDVVGATSFGALSESELALALDTALPSKLPPVELRRWLVDKRSAQEKLRAGLEQASIFFQNGGTVGDFVKLGREQRLAEEQQKAAPVQRFVFNPATGKVEPQ